MLNPRLLQIKIARRIYFKYKSWKVRSESYFNYNAVKIPNNFKLSQLSHLITKPGNPLFFDRYYANNIPHIDHDFENVISHKFKILSEEYFFINNGTSANLPIIAILCEELPHEVVNKYQPIDWHCDHKSGYKWDDNVFYLDVPLLPLAGVDIKVPRELSRFQHIGEMFFAEKTLASNEFFLQIVDWISANPNKKGVNWACNMDVAIRAINWIWGLRFFEVELATYPKLQVIIGKSLLEHGQHIYNNLEYYEESTGNHYLSNIAGLIYISSRIPGYEHSDLWLMFGLQELTSEMERQVFDDGFAHEGSSSYHRLVAELFLSTSVLVERIPLARQKKLLKVETKSHNVKPMLDAVVQAQLNLSEIGNILPSKFYEKLQLMIEFSSSLTKPNGRVPQIGDNDSARVHKLVPSVVRDDLNHTNILALGGEVLNDSRFKLEGINSSLEAEIIAGDFSKNGLILTTRASEKYKFFKQAGIAILTNSNAWASVVCGSNGQNKRGGHGHNDKNSFELNVAGNDYIVDAGCPFYTSNPINRNKYRSTFAHSTLAVEGKEQDQWQSGISGLFALEERCCPKLKNNDNGTISGEHCGFGEKHLRTFILSSLSFEINDYCETSRAKYLLYNLDPNVVVTDLVISENNVMLLLNNQNGHRIRMKINDVKNPQIIDGYFSEGFGRPLDNKMIRVDMLSDSAKTVFSWR